MTWGAVRLAARKFGAWCKRNWKFMLGLSIPVIVWLLTRRSFNSGKIIDRIKSDYEREIGVIERTHKMEREKKEMANFRYLEAIQKIEEHYEEEQKKLSVSKKRQVKKIIEENAHDPDAITKALAALTGAKIHVE